MPEQVFFVDSAVQITSTEATFGQICVPVADIKSAQVAKIPLKRNWIFTTALALIIISLLLFALRWFVLGPDDPAFGIAFGAGNLALLIGWLLMLYWLRDAKFLVRLIGTFGEKDVVVTRTPSYARKVVRAINEAAKSTKANET